MNKYAVLLKAVDISSKSRKEVGDLGERIVCEYLRRHGFLVIARNVSRKTGEIDIIAREGQVLHFVEVKTILAARFPNETDQIDQYDPSLNLHEEKIRKVARTGEWYVSEQDWEGEWQVDGCLVWIRKSDGVAKVRYLPQIA